MGKEGMGLTEIKEYNRALVLQLICTNPGSTRAFLAEKSSLTKMTLTNITNELMQKQWIEESNISVPQGTAGRNPKKLELSQNAPVVVGMWISRCGLRGVVADPSLRLVCTRYTALTDDDNAETVMQKIERLGSELAAATKRRVLGIGIASIGIIDQERGSVEKVVNFYGADRLLLKERLSNLFDAPVFVCNDMHASVLSELYFGLGRRASSFIYLGITDGVGSAAVAGRQVLHNTGTSSGEMGHMSMDLQGPVCACGSRGCLEMYVSIPVITRTINQAFGTSFESFEEAMAFCDEDHSRLAALADIEEKLSYAINNLTNIIGIPTVVIGHSGALFPKPFVDALQQRINALSIFRGSKTISLLKTHFQDDSPLYGAACVVLDKLFTGQLPL